MVLVDLIHAELYGYEGKTSGVTIATRLTLNRILERAVQKKIESQHFYSELSQKMTNDAAKDVLQQLSEQDQRHQGMLEQCRQGELKSED